MECIKVSQKYSYNFEELMFMTTFSIFSVFM